jgi:hypothetical protein
MSWRDDATLEAIVRHGRSGTWRSWLRTLRAIRRLPVTK